MCEITHTFLGLDSRVHDRLWNHQNLSILLLWRHGHLVDVHRKDSDVANKEDELDHVESIKQGFCGLKQQQLYHVWPVFRLDLPLLTSVQGNDR